MPQKEDELYQEYLERLLAELADAVVGASYHDLHGYNYSEAEIEELTNIIHRHWDRALPSRVGQKGG